ncbi:MAG: PEP-CTERM sorting domain-containing protein [Candidatus Tectomicrobia bacterium]|uniref:PEP-CTERM sorting domain-containing protein n=1 Tax=Tectimicrobiota bacterium TaxID=2528274 RepID=A0A937W5N9_UNCTE|nr:PEP-CTERM sorting domain-containing protein [Candidatus Tectomicrobia bacterium]
MPLIGLGTAQNGTDLAVSTIITTTDTLTSGAGVGDYSPIPPLASFGPATLDLTDLAAFALSNVGFGSFDAGAGSFVVSQSPNFLDVFLLGVFTPGPGLAAGLDPTPTSLRISLNQSGASISMAITLNTPPAPPNNQVPEPGTWVLMSIGTLGLLGYGWRRRS